MRYVPPVLSTYAYAGMPVDGLHHVAPADRLSPRDFTQAGSLSVAGLCHFMAGRYAEAAGFERRAVDLRPNFGNGLAKRFVSRQDGTSSMAAIPSDRESKSTSSRNPLLRSALSLWSVDSQTRATSLG